MEHMRAAGLENTESLQDQALAATRRRDGPLKPNALAPWD